MKDCGLHLESNKEIFAGFKMGGQIGFVFQQEFTLALACWEIDGKQTSYMVVGNNLCEK